MIMEKININMKDENRKGQKKMQQENNRVERDNKGYMLKIQK
jgi:hypothetical protein